MNYDVIIIGGGASGLLAMNLLLDEGYSVCLLEANGQCGGRISTQTGLFSVPVDTGGEFIHGNQSLTIQLLREAKSGFHEITGTTAEFSNGQWSTTGYHDEHWQLLLKKLAQTKTDTTLDQFLKNHFNEDEYADLRIAAKQFAVGYDLAKPEHLSVLGIKNEWLNEDQTQYRIPDGYSSLTDLLERKCRDKGGTIFVRTRVVNIKHSRGDISVITEKGEAFIGKKAVLTISAGLLQKHSIVIEPLPDTYKEAISRLGFGSVIKFLLEFSTRFWDQNQGDLSMILSDQPVPTWWTQQPINTNILTGWLGGRQADDKEFINEEGLLADAIASLSTIFSIPVRTIKAYLLQYHISSWTRSNLIAAGGYSYPTIYTEAAVSILQQPLNDSLYFAGEAVSTGGSRGTVEAALESGKFVAESIISANNSK